MKNNYNLIAFFLILCIVSLNSCSSVKTRNAKKIAEPLVRQMQSEKPNISKSKDEPVVSNSKYPERFRDTLVINTDNSEIVTGLNTPEFQSALQAFDEEKYSLAYTLFKAISNSSKSLKTTIQWSKFYMAECKLAELSFQEPEIILKDLIENISVDQELKQQSMVRLGQMLCESDRKKEAEELFNKLKSDFPASKYKKYAKCL